MGIADEEVIWCEMDGAPYPFEPYSLAMIVRAREHVAAGQPVAPVLPFAAMDLAELRRLAEASLLGVLDVDALPMPVLTRLESASEDDLVEAVAEPHEFLGLSSPIPWHPDPEAERPTPQGPAAQPTPRAAEPVRHRGRPLLKR